MDYNDVRFNGLDIKFTKAMKKTLGEDKSGRQKTIQGYTWSQLYYIQNYFRGIKTKIDLHDHFKPIFEHTNIGSMKLEYNGYGDDGCLESLELRDTNGMKIYPSHMLRHFYMKIYHGENVTQNNVFNYHLWESDAYTRQLRKYITDREKFLIEMDSEEFETLDLEDFSNGIVQSILNMGWSLHSVSNNSDERGITLRKQQNEDIIDADFTYFDTRVLKLMYPRVFKDTWDNIDEAFYGMLQPGWQNNHGSQNSFLVELKDNKVHLTVNQETNVMVQETENTKVTLDDTLSTRLKGFIKDIFPKNKMYENNSLDFSLKKDQSKLKELHDFTKSMIKENVTVTREEE